MGSDYPSDLPYRSRRRPSPQPSGLDDDYDRPRRRAAPRDDDRRSAPRRAPSYDASGSDSEYERRRPTKSKPSRRAPVEEDDYPPRRSNTTREPRYDSMEPPRRSRTTRESRPRYSDDEDDSPPPPRRRPRERDDRDEYDRGYKSESKRDPFPPSRRARDYYDRGYATDSRRAAPPSADKYSRADKYDKYASSDRRDRDPERERRRRQYEEDLGYGPRDERRKRDRGVEGRAGASGGMAQFAKYKDKVGMGNVDMDKIGRYVETGQKHWKTVEPIAKPIAMAMAKRYMGGR